MLLPFIVVELDVYAALGSFIRSGPRAVGVRDQDPDLAAVRGLGDQQVGSAFGFEDVEERFVEQVDPIGRARIIAGQSGAAGSLVVG